MTRDFFGLTLADYYRMYPGLIVSTPEHPRCWGCGGPVEPGKELEHVHDWKGYDAMNQLNKVGSTMERNREQGFETMVINHLIDETQNWGIAVADKDYDPSKSLGQEPK